jgi:hypothetical protein
MVLARQESCVRLSRGPHPKGPASHPPPSQRAYAAPSSAIPGRSTDPSRTTLAVIGGVRVINKAAGLLVRRTTPLETAQPLPARLALRLPLMPLACPI